jgi:motility quorum-sensing regulator / GCU-specific mRNA interferase toxin
MEKRTPHCTLAVVKALVAAGKIRATFSALAGGAALGFGFEEIVGVIAALTAKDFYKSMTTYADHRT